MPSINNSKTSKRNAHKWESLPEANGKMKLKKDVKLVNKKLIVQDENGHDIVEFTLNVNDLEALDTQPQHPEHCTPMLALSGCQ